MNNPKCEYCNQPNINEQTSYYCYTCLKIICENCLKDHKIKKEFINHKCEILNDIIIKIISKKKKIELDLSTSYNNIINSNNKEGIEFINNKINKYAKILNGINNAFRKEFNDYKQNFNEFDNQKKLLIENISKINGDTFTLEKLTQAHEITNKIFRELIARINKINRLYDYTNNFFNNINNIFNNTNNNIINFNNNTINTNNNSNNNSHNNINNNSNINYRNNNTININNNSNNNNNNNIIQNKKIIFEKINNNNIFLSGDIFQNTQKSDINKKEEDKKIQNEEQKIIKERVDNSMYFKIEFDKNKNTKEEVETNKNKNENNKNNNKKIVNQNINNNINIKLIENENKKKDIIKDKPNNMHSINTEKNKQKEKENDKLNSFNKNNILLNFINDIQDKNGNNLINKKKKREESNSKEKAPFLNDIYNQNDKKLKIDNQNNFFKNSSPKKELKEEEKNNITNINNSIINNNNNIIIPKEIKKNEKIKYLFGLSGKLKEVEMGEIIDNDKVYEDIELERIVVLTELKNDTALIKYFNHNQITYEKNNIYSSKFPYKASRLVTINNEAFVIGGRINNYIDNIGVTLCFKISFINNNNNGGLGEIKCKFMRNTNFRHHSHSVLYSKLYNTIFVLAGHYQNKCEYAKLNNKGEIDKWEEMLPIKRPREDPINFLLNDKFIYLLGGIKDKGKGNTNNDSYDVFDISTLFDNGLPPTWKQINVTTDQYTKPLFEALGPGIVELNNKIYVLGGLRKEKEEFMAWKISFNERKIEKIEKFETNDTFKEKKNFSFLGQQLFMLYDDNYVNINWYGKCEVFHRNLFNNSFE